MNELIDVLMEIRDGIYTINSNIDELKAAVNELRGSGLYNTISDVCDKIDTAVSDIKGNGLYDTISDVASKLDDVSSTLDRIDINTM
ncbi:hypothetical protein [Paenibacillus odorifer]|uniref:Uncharacterized protein n=1 Tax=Paenibacillus odorifer TaxID=189426 RepID=A0A1R0Y1G6_9BACL|nr:hypothetical protein [Paenibacillus odorifer]OMD41127.1 hypothetical protein BSK52_11900 [Paenibacillus odorifer]